MRRKTWAAAAAVGALLLAGCGAQDSDEPDAEQPPAEVGEEQAPEMPEPDLEGVPDVVAVVNGDEVSRDEFVTTYESMFTQAAMQSQMTGEEVDEDALKEQTVTGMVDTRLLLQEADERELTASDDEVDETVEELVAANGLESADEFYETLEADGLSKEEVLEQVADQVRIEQLYAAEGGDYEPTDEDVEARYEEMVAQQPPGEDAEEPPALDEVRDEVAAQLQQQHEQEAIAELLEEIRDGAEITINL